jgi:hypothetical protein
MKTPFTPEQFFGVFEHYNQSVFPAQFIISLLGLASLILLHVHNRAGQRFTGWFLGLLWIWTGLVYHIGFFSEINPIAKVFGGLFIFQGVLNMVEANHQRLQPSLGPGFKATVGYFLIWFGFLIYPIISYFAESSFVRTISLGLPCPTTIFTLGFFVLTTQQYRKYLLIIPSLWAVVGISAAINFGVHQDLMILVAAITALFFRFQNKTPRK